MNWIFVLGDRLQDRGSEVVGPFLDPRFGGFGLDWNRIRTIWEYGSPGLILGAFYTIFRAGPVWRGPGAKFGWKAAQNRPKLESIFQFPIKTAGKVCINDSG